MKTFFNKKIGLLFILTITLVLTGCESEDSFLESDYRGVIEPRTVNDFDLMLNAYNLSTADNSGATGAPIQFLTDDVGDARVWLANQAASQRAYRWGDQIYTDDDEPGAWTKSYRNIYTYNTIYYEIDDVVDAVGVVNEERVKRYKAEALLGRAFEHLFLVNLFSQPYSEANKTKPGIPYMTSIDITAQVPPRETIEDTYNKIEADLLEAIPNLPNTADDNTRGSKIGAYGILGRVYLYKGEWDKALTYIQKALDIKSDYVNYITLPFFTYPSRPTKNTDDVYVRTNSNGNLAFTQKVSEELIELYKKDTKDNKDPRVDSFIYFYPFGSLLYGSPTGLTNGGVKVPELIVTKAELLVRLDRIDEGLNLINDFRSTRVSAVPFATTNKEQALTWVLEERRRELAINGLRWFDMRRLDIEGRMGTVTHIDTSTGDTFTLEPGSPRYTLQIPQVIIDQEGFEQNP